MLQKGLLGNLYKPASNLSKRKKTQSVKLEILEMPEIGDSNGAKREYLYCSAFNNLYLKSCNALNCCFKSNHQRCVIRKCIIQNLAKLTRKHVCQSLFLINLHNTFLQNTSKRLLLLFLVKKKTISVVFQKENKQKPT